MLALAPAVPTIPISFHLSTDDLIPLVGLGALIAASPLPRGKPAVVWRIAIGALLVATLARVGSSIVNATGFENALASLAEAVARPAFLGLAAVYVATAQPAYRRQQVVARALAAIGTFEAAFGLAGFLLALPFGAGVQPKGRLEDLGGCASRITGTLGLSPNHYGAVLVVTIPFTVALAMQRSGWMRWLWLGAVMLQGAALSLSFTRASFLLASAAAVVLLLLFQRFRLMAAAVAGTALLVVAITGTSCSTAGGSPGQPAPSASAQPQPPTEIVNRFGDATDRAALWYSATRIMLDHPWFGVGLGRMVDVMASQPAEYVYTPFGTATNSAHNTVLLAGAETGVVGAAATLILNVALALAAVGWMIRRKRAVLATAAGLAVLAFLAQGMVNNLFTVPATGTLLALVVGAFASAAIDGPGQTAAS